MYVVKSFSRKCTNRSRLVFPWCGLLIDMTDLSILADYTRYSGTGKCPPLLGISLTRTVDIDLKDSLTVDKCRNPGVNFVHKMLRSVPSTLGATRR